MSCCCITASVVISIIVIVVVIAIPIFMKFRKHSKLSIHPTEPVFKVSNVEFTKPNFIDSLDSFGAELYSELSQSYGEKNVFLSPFSIQTSLAMTRMGVEGQTALEIDDRLHIAGKSLESVADNYHNILAKYENNSILNIANKIYVMKNYEVREDFNITLSQKFFSSAENIDFSQSEKAASLMNNWVENKTENAIKKFVSPDVVNGDTRIFLLSAIHFKGEWTNEFHEDATSEEDFYTTTKDQNNTLRVQMMYKKELCYYNIFPELNATAVRLPYRDSDLSMLVLLPNSIEGLTELEKKLKSLKLETITKELQDQTSVRLYLPKFKTEFQVELKDVLIKLGIKRMFHSGEFGKMLKSSEPTQVSNVIHKAFIEVNEKGTKAAAATGLAIVTRDGGGIQSIEFRADHPFYYIITNSDNVRLFEGKFVGF